VAGVPVKSSIRKPSETLAERTVVIDDASDKIGIDGLTKISITVKNPSYD